MADPDDAEARDEGHPEDQGIPEGQRIEVDNRGGRGLVDVHVPWRIFLAVGGFVAFYFVLYGATSHEFAGSALLALTSALALWVAVFLWRNANRMLQEAEGTRHGEHLEAGAQDAAYMPQSSPWPFGIGLGSALAANGLLIGVWFLLPGAMVLAVSIAGWARESRHRRS